MWNTKPRRVALACAIPTLLALALPGARADTLFIGPALLRNHASLGDLSGFNTPPGLNLDIGNAATLGLAYVHDLGPHLSAELALGLPPVVASRAAGANWNALGIPVGSTLTRTSMVFPTLFLNYHPLGEASRWDPFAGVGVNLTRFVHANSQHVLNSRLGPTVNSLSTSTGAALHVGVIRHLDARWSIVASVARIDVRSKLTTTSYSPLLPGVVTSQATTNINFRPLVLGVAIGCAI